MKSSKTICPIILLIASMVACTSSRNEIVIGVIGPLSGPMAQIGIESKRGAILAADDINRRGGVAGKQIRIVNRDDSDYSKITAMMRDLVAKDRPSAVIGPESIAAVRSKNNPLTRASIPILTVAGSAGPLGGNPSLFRMTPANSDIASALSNWLVDVRSLTKFAIVSSSDEWGSDGAKATVRMLEAAGGSVVVNNQIVPGTADVSGLVQAIKLSGADAIVMWLRPSDAARFVNAVRTIGSKVQIAGPDSLFETGFRSIAGSNSENAVVIMPSIKPEDWFGEPLMDWFVAYHKRFTLLPIKDQRTLVADLPLTALRAYDAVGVVADAITRSGSVDPAGVADALSKTSGYQGMIKRYWFSRNNHEALRQADLQPARFFNLALVYDIAPGADIAKQIAFYKVQVSAYYVPDEYRETKEGKKLFDRVLEDVLTNPDQVEFFRAYEPPLPSPGPL